MLLEKDVSLYHEWSISVIFEQNNVLSEPLQQFLHDTFTMGSNGKNNIGQILLQGIATR